MHTNPCIGVQEESIRISVLYLSDILSLFQVHALQLTYCSGAGVMTAGISSPECSLGQAVHKVLSALQKPDDERTGIILVLQTKELIPEKLNDRPIIPLESSCAKIQARLALAAIFYPQAHK